MFRTHVLEHGRTYVLKNHVPEHELEHHVPNMTEHMFQKIMFQNMIWNMEHVHVPVLFLFPVNPEHEQHCNKPLVLHLNTRLKHLNQPMRSPR